MSPYPLVLVILFVLGGAVGSFVNACAYRIPEGISVISPRSFCPNCNRALSWYEIVPIMSFLIQKGKCRTCRSAISPQYLIVEISCAASAVACYAVYGFSAELVVALGFAPIMLLVALIDWHHFIIPNKIVLTGIFIGFVIRSILVSDDLLEVFPAMASGVGIMLLIRLSGNALFKKETMGMGDVKLAALISLFLGFKGFLIAAWLAAVMGSVYVLVRFRLPCLETKTVPGGTGPIPLGSFLAVASCCVLLFGDPIRNLIQTWWISIQ